MDILGGKKKGIIEKKIISQGKFNYKYLTSLGIQDFLADI